MALRKFNPCDSCCITIGFEWSAQSPIYNCGAYRYWYNLKDNPNKIWECNAAFLGRFNTFPDADTQVMSSSICRDYLQQGGRIYIQGEYRYRSGTDENGNPTWGGGNNINVNNWLAAVGSSMEIGSPNKCCNGSCVGWTGSMNQSVGWLWGIEAIYHAATNHVYEGIWLAKTNSEIPDPEETRPEFNCETPFPFLAMERIGRGLLVVSGDSDLASCQSNCAFWKAFIEEPLD